MSYTKRNTDQRETSKEWREKRTKKEGERGHTMKGGEVLGWLESNNV